MNKAIATKSIGIPMPPGTMQFVERAARCTEPVLLLGETGSGKTRIARLIHEMSCRSKGPFQSVNCSAIPRDLFEREMFGHIRGAFTDAKDSRAGLFEAATKGTLFFDEIGELPLAAQPKLLNAFEQHRIRRLGETHDTPVDVRIVAATNADLGQMMGEQHFRSDLYYRFAVLVFTLPPLRHRRDTLGAIIAGLLDCIATASKPPELTVDALRALKAYPWPGNLRELDNALRYALVYSDGQIIRMEDLPPHISAPDGGAMANSLHPDKDLQTRYSAPTTPEQELETILEALQCENMNKSKAARRLGMGRSTLWAKLQRHQSSLSPLQHPIPDFHAD